jgi:hypothetical protein
MATTPGQRMILFASAGLLAGGENFERAAVIERAIQANVMINGLDARGL